MPSVALGVDIRLWEQNLIIPSDASMVEAKFVEAIEIIAKRLGAERIQWALVGSTNLALQGMDITPHDLDVVLTFKDLDRIPALFPEYSPTIVTKLEPIVNDAWDVKMNIGGVDIQIFAENDSGVYVSKLLANKLTILKIKTFDIPCFTLEADSQAYVETKCQEKADRIKEFLENRRS